MTTNTPTIDRGPLALRYAGEGFAVFPLHTVRDGRCTCGDGECPSPGKHPNAALAPHGFKDATTDAATIRAWWATRPDANIGIATGAASGIVALDEDNKPGKSGAATVEARTADLGPLPATVRTCTPSGGHHSIFAHPGVPVPNSAEKLGPALDVRGDGGYIVAPGSEGAGGLYRFADGHGLDDVGLADLPPAWVEAMKRPPAPPAARPSTPPPSTYPPRPPSNNLARRLAAYVAAAPPAPEGQRNDTAFRLAGNLAAIRDDHGTGATVDEIIEAMRPWAAACSPPFPVAELAGAVWSSMHNGTPREPKPASAAIGATPAAVESPMPTFVTVGQLVAKYRELREPVIDGFLRRGELGNVIAAPKMRKSWLVLALAVCKATGTPWLGHEMKPGRVLLIDLELHPETLARRLRDVLLAFGLSSDALGDRLVIETFRGKHVDAATFGPYFRAIGPDRFDLVIIDPLYRLIPADGDENANAQMAGLFTRLIGYADELNAAVMLVHHASKGNQSEKSTTDVGAGAGAQSRAADAHIVLREHKSPDAAVVSSVVRSWPPAPDVALRWVFPRWEIAPDLDPTEFKVGRGRTKPTDTGPTEPPAPPWTPERLAAEFVGPMPRRRDAIQAAAMAAGMGGREFDRTLAAAEAGGIVHRVIGANRSVMFTTTAPDLKNL
ncbi:MAG: bifunctional DNA primase/polymerase [Planctomycetota bacterium]|nr:bifunctional DNA primase/polymerase [Planctomycetota bacterium]